MRKKSFHDINAPEKKSIRDIPLLKDNPDYESEAPIRHHHNKVGDIRVHKSVETEESDIEIEDEEDLGINFRPKKSVSGKHRGVAWLIAIISISALFVVFLTIRGTADIDIKMKSFSFPLNDQTFVAIKDTADANISYATISIDVSEKESVPKKGEKTVNEKAKGTIIIYNNFSTSAQTLVANTRFETPGGLIYRLEKQTVVPGIKTVSGKKTPGSIEAVVIADQPGEKYNISFNDFTIPGFKDSPKYEGFYARSKTAMSGGSVGTVAVIDESDQLSIENSIKEKIKSEITTKIENQIPSDSFMPNGAYDVSFTSSQPKSIDDKTAEVIVTAKIKAYVINKLELATFVAQKNNTEIISGSDIEIDKEKIEIKDISENDNKLSFITNGSLNFSYVLDQNKFKDSTKSMPKDVALNSVLEIFPGIEKIKITTKPFWKSSIPENTEKININLE